MNDIHLAKNVGLKGLGLFILCNLMFAWLYPMAAIGKISGYNLVFPGRVRLPYGDNPDKAYNLSLYNLEAMFASHEINGGIKTDTEYRVILIGDSSTWGYLLPAEETYAEMINAQNPTLSDGRDVKVYNLGYPVMSLMKDLLILSYAKRYQPDMIVWLVTLESFPYDKQLYPPLLQNNRTNVVKLINQYDLNLDPNDPQLIKLSPWERTFFGSRRALADIFRLQFYGSLWAATGIDQEIPDNYPPPQADFTEDLAFHNLTPPHLMESDLALEMISAGMEMVQPIPMMIINEPIFISQGINSDIRYDFYYPRWAYDDYRKFLDLKAKENNWIYHDHWNEIPSTEFSNSAVHLTVEGSRQFAEIVLQEILSLANQ
jgi:hypothetical protein